MADDGGGSRLDRLLRLLETGSSPAARNEAARQIGELASAHPNQLPNLLRRVRTQIRNRAGARPPGRVRFRCAEDLADPRDSRATSPGSSARARSRRRDTVFHLRIHPAWLARYRRRRDSPHRPSRPVPHTKKKIRGFLKHKQWETRVASARTIAHICEGVKHATVADIARLEGISPEQAVERAAHLKPTSEEDDDAAGDLAFAEFDIVGVLERAAPLLAAKSGDDALFGGAENDKDDAKKQLSKAERLRLAKQTLKQRLGMALDSTLEGAAEERDGATTRADAGDAGPDPSDAAAAGDVSVSAKANLDVDKFVDVDDLVGEEDVAEVKVEANDDAEKKMDASDLTQLSARERNRLKRKAKRGARDAADGVEPVAKRGRKPGSTGASGKNAVDPETAARLAAEAAEEEDEAAEVEAGGWPLARTCEKLAYSLFAPRWEERHGAAAALREVLRTHAASAAVPSPPPRARGVEPDAAARAARKNASWLEDAAVRLLCVLSLDRFGDYVGDGVVAPVRETGAQALGAGLLPLPPRAVEAVVTCILVLLRRPEWEVRHSALLALRYVLAARDALAPRLLPAALPAATAALDDKDDDVRGAAAEALLPAARHLPTHRDFPPLLAGLWTLLGRLDDPDLLTSPSNVPVMRLVSALYALPATRATPPRGPGSALRDVVPSLFPFAAHPIAAVRLAVWQTLGQLMRARDGRATAGGTDAGAASPERGARDDWVDAAAATAMRVSFQATLLEEDAETAAAASAAWRDLCHVASAGAVAAAVDAHVEGWCALAATAADARPDARLLCVVSLSGGAGGTITGADDRAPTSTSEWVVTTAGRLRAVAALSQLAKVLCAPGNDDGVDDAGARADAVPKTENGERASAAAKLEAQVTRLLSEGSATRRMTGSFLLASWLDAIPAGAPKPPLAQPGARLGELLAATDPAYPSAPSPAPYAEVASLVARVKRESAGLLRAAADNNVRPTTSEVPSPAADGFGAAHAATLAAAIPAVRRRLLPVSSIRSCFSRSRFSVSVSVRRASSFFFFSTAKRRTDRSFGFVALGTPRRRSGRAVAVRRGHHPRAPTSEVFAARERAQQVSPRLALAGVK